MSNDTSPGDLKQALTPPERLRADHDLSDFDSGNQSLDHWLKHRALHNDHEDASRTYVVCEGHQVIGYYSLCTGSINRMDASGRLRRNMPDPIPVMLLGRLAVDLAWQRHGIGAALLRDAVLRTMQVADIAGVKALLVHAISDKAVEFYKKWGFHPSPANPRTLFLSMREVRYPEGQLAQ